ncbi:MAG: type II toxin-antitoxin system Phd/YefM family antitoxin [Nitrospirota bacterium]|jgi:antitoxin (DNA-binding transcriptional repressor) of toxin-antitoxin stability system
MKIATAKELRYRTSSILENVRKGREFIITMRGKSIAILKPLKRHEKRFNPIGFGLWKDRKDLKDVKEWINEKRGARFKK